MARRLRRYRWHSRAPRSRRRRSFPRHRGNAACRRRAAGRRRRPPVPRTSWAALPNVRDLLLKAVEHAFEEIERALRDRLRLGQFAQDLVAHARPRAARSRRPARSTTDECAPWPALRSPAGRTCAGRCHRARAPDTFPRTPSTLRLAGSESMPSSRSGEERWKKLSACDCTNCPQCSSSRSIAAAAGISTAMIASHAFTEASRWLTGQMPQMRAVMPGIS